MIRCATHDDIGAIVELCTRSMAATYGHIFDAEQMRPWLEGPETLNFVTNAIDKTWVFERDVGLVGVIVIDADLVELLWVDEPARGAGVGGRLMEHADSLVVAKHVEARLECFTDNASAIEFYEHLGWSITREFDDPLSGARKVEMRKPLG